jgi:TolB-like protein/DNA-binding winged helix-turn-helix (wHTH) protein/Tfp pilus assembly protein PilF
MNAGTDSVSQQPFQLDRCYVEPDSGRLLREGKEVRLEPKVMEVLVYLAQHPGQVVSREMLEATVWAGMVVGYEAVSQSINKLRKALQDDPRNPRYIETVSKKGYRLVAPVMPADDRAQEFREAVQPARSRFTAGRIKLLAAVSGVLFVIGLLVFLVGETQRSGPPAATIPSVAVLPFKTLGADPRQDYLSEGITDDLITDLSRLDSVRVIAGQSSRHYKGNPAALKEIARQLGVLYVVEGSVQKSGERLRINVQLTNTEDDETIWAERFDADTGDIFRVQDSISKKVMDAMYVTLSGEGVARGTLNFDAYDAFLIGQQHIKTRSRQGYDLAMNAYRRAIRIDPNYARAYGAMAVALTRGYRYQWTDLSLVEARERAMELAKKAVALNQSTPQIYWSLGYVYLHRRDYDAAEESIRQSVALSPNYADGYALLANIANWRGNAQYAVTYIEKAAALNPYYSFQYPSTLGMAWYNLDQYEKARAALAEALDRNENAVNPRLYLAAVYVRLGHVDEAEWEISQVRVSRPEVALSNLGTLLPYEHREALDRLSADLRKAGLPE